MTKETRHFFILRSVDNLRHCFDVIKSIYKGGLYSVTVAKYVKRRSMAQHRTMWMWINAMSEDTGHTPDELHEKFKVKFLGVEEKEVEGEILRYPISTTTLDTKQFTEYLEKIELVAVDLGIILPYPDDIKYAMEGK